MHQSTSAPALGLTLQAGRGGDERERTQGEDKNGARIKKEVNAQRETGEWAKNGFGDIGSSSTLLFFSFSFFPFLVVDFVLVCYSVVRPPRPKAVIC